MKDSVLPKPHDRIEAWDAFINMIGDQYMNRVQVGDTVVSQLLNEYALLKNMRDVGHKMARLAEKERYSIKAIPEIDASPEAWDQFIEELEYQHIRRTKRGEDLLGGLLEQYDINKEKINNNKISEIFQEWIEEHGEKAFKHLRAVNSLEHLINMTYAHKEKRKRRMNFINIPY